MRHFDVAVIGGGPAGLAASLTLRRASLSVLVVERSRYSSWRAGETLPPDIVVPLTELGVWPRFEAQGHAPSSGIHSAWGAPEVVEREFFFHPHGNGWHVDRTELDGMLAAAADHAGAELVRGTRLVGLTPTPTGMRLALDGGDDAVAGTVIDATGRCGAVARSAGARWLAYDRMVGVVAVVADPCPDIEPVLMVEAVEHGWWYSAPRGDGSIVVAAMTDADLLRASRLKPAAWWRTRMEGTFHTAARLGPLRTDPPVRVRRAETARLDRAVGDGWVATGDAASAVDPLAGMGVHRALTGGIRAARAILDHRGGDRSALDDYAQGIVHTFERDLAARSTVYRQEARWPASAFWRRRQPPVVEDVVLSLDPTAAAGAAATGTLEGLLPLDDLRLLSKLCRAPAKAADVAASFRNQAGAPPDDRTLVAALQLALSATT